MSNAIQTRGTSCRLSKSFAIRHLDLNVPEGSIYGFLGPNGSGKTTTIQLLLALRRAGEGSIDVLGRSIPSQIIEVLARTGYVPERPHLHPSLTVGEGLQFHSAFFTTWDWRWANELLHQFDLELPQRIGRLSKGQTGKLMVLLALAQKPELLVLDEPTDGLNPEVRRDVIGALLSYVSDRKATVLISSHLVHELERICDWVEVMDRGRLVVEMPMERFKNGMKRLRVCNPPSDPSSTPFSVLSREASQGGNNSETWVVQGWERSMNEYFEQHDAILAEVIDLDLEDGLWSCYAVTGWGLRDMYVHMFRVILYTQWKWSRLALFVGFVSAFALPILSVQQATITNPSELEAADLMASMLSWSPWYAALAAALGLVVAVIGWAAIIGASMSTR